jgi:hypothetical protein
VTEDEANEIAKHALAGLHGLPRVASVTPRGQRFCDHRAKGYDRQGRRVWCRLCGAPLDVFALVDELVRDHDERERLRAERSKLIADIASLEKDRANARARAHRAKSTAPNPDVECALAGVRELGAAIRAADLQKAARIMSVLRAISVRLTKP